MWDRDQEKRNMDDRGGGGPRDLRENLDRGRRDVDRGRDRGGRRSWSRSRSRSRERAGKRRADSPFTKAHDNWSKFKQAEKVIMELDEIISFLASAAKPKLIIGLGPRLDRVGSGLG